MYLQRIRNTVSFCRSKKMFFETAQAIKRLLANMTLDGATVINFGSSTEEFCKVKQPWIWRDVLEPITQRGARLVNVDEKADGAWIERSNLPQDESGDVMLCCSLLEHVVPVREIVDQMRQSLKVGGVLVLDVPAQYPYHADPVSYTHLRAHET